MVVFGFLVFYSKLFGARKIFVIFQSSSAVNRVCLVGGFEAAKVTGSPVYGDLCDPTFCPNRKADSF